MCESIGIYSFEKHTKQQNPNKLKIECPLRFNAPESGTECIQEYCAWWMIIQKACAINVNARQYYQSKK
jgi:hypothetical protein